MIVFVASLKLLTGKLGELKKYFDSGPTHMRWL